VEFPWQRFPFAEANLYFAHAVGAARLGNPVEARQQIERLTEIQKRLSEVKIGYDWATQVDIQRQTATAWALHAEGKNDEALRLMRAAADLEDTTEKHPVTPGAILPAREMLGDLLLEVNRPAAALVEFETVLQNSPGRFNSLYGAGRAADLAGVRRKARLYYGKLVAQCGQSDGGRLRLSQARIYIKTR
jgi:tetratricopeptide (TPR) repeat protein